MKAPNHIPLLPAEEYERRQRRETSSVPALWDLLDEVKDPEIPVISLWELGVLQDIAVEGDTVVVTITPTYSGCPAMTVMAEDVVTALAAAGYHSTEIVTRLAPAWSSLWMSPEAKEKLRHYGIAPPGCGSTSAPEPIACPHCGSDDVRKISEFGSTACKSLYQCGDCREPFDYFKPI
ncbi:phenylacetate-CoA oxygenase subunit PaaJ [Kineobactrum sediminis]|uniref:Phenylacetate-CoA oxygenase subunit PaaJ n=1 Tax=Kineobactrum sediminis TaxID=1905677 RepID=A0A2N5Y1V9_9GAMM|nr:1,2-phenylacetyl-CoA epoxidase subunit PaaD [Kineobactrum sediminis]PLW82373.1 phenylacetate-CoA oxygenase subunit PaaJ [Kineobactrum sediminis]